MVTYESLLYTAEPRFVLKKQLSIVVYAFCPVTTAEFLLLMKVVFLTVMWRSSALIPASADSLIVTPSNVTFPPFARIPFTAFLLPDESLRVRFPFSEKRSYLCAFLWIMEWPLRSRVTV